MATKGYTSRRYLQSVTRANIGMRMTLNCVRSLIYWNMAQAMIFIGRHGGPCYTNFHSLIRKTASCIIFMRMVICFCALRMNQTCIYMAVTKK